MLKKITAPAAGADDAELHRVVGASCLQHAGRALYRWDGGRHRGHRSGGLHEIAAGDILILRHDEHLILLFSPHFSMHVLVTELLVARIVQWMLRPAAVALWLGTLIVPLHTQPAPPPPSPVQIKDLQIPKLTTPPAGSSSSSAARRAPTSAGSYNRVAALDTRLTLTSNWTFAGQVMTSQTREFDGTQSGGPTSLEGFRPEEFADRGSFFRFGRDPRGFDILPDLRQTRQARHRLPVRSPGLPL